VLFGVTWVREKCRTYEVMFIAQRRKGRLITALSHLSVAGVRRYSDRLRTPGAEVDRLLALSFSFSFS
jgi:hypothetical protein